MRCCIVCGGIEKGQVWKEGSQNGKLLARTKNLLKKGKSAPPVKAITPLRPNLN